VSNFQGARQVLVETEDLACKPFLIFIVFAIVVVVANVPDTFEILKIESVVDS
jgi:hypothetical protein